MMDTRRIEQDDFGAAAIPADRLWGVQTQLSLQHFRISTELMPAELIHALAEVKRACALVNRDLGLLHADKAETIIQAADEVLAGDHAEEFPLSVWQTGSGTHTHMNLNEVLAQRASRLLRARGKPLTVHPNDDVNLGQSSNDILPTAMHLAASLGLSRRLLPALNHLRQTLEKKSEEFADIIKVGRTHLQDAAPLTLGQEFSGYAAQLVQARAAIVATLPLLHDLAVGGTAVGTGLNTHPEFGARVAEELSHRCLLPLRSADNKFAALASHDAMVAAHGALKTLAAALMKIANDIRWLASGPNAGLAEIAIPENEPGSSIMPGKANPSQCEAVTMLCCQVFGNDVAINLGGASGSFELNVYKPLIAHNFLQSVRLLGDGMASLDEHCVRGIAARQEHIAELLERSLMLATALTPHIGYDRTAEIVKLARLAGIGLKQAGVRLGFLTEAQFDEWVQPARMLQPDLR
jgi:fumarate hydratase class II